MKELSSKEKHEIIMEAADIVGKAIEGVIDELVAVAAKSGMSPAATISSAMAVILLKGARADKNGHLLIHADDENWVAMGPVGASDKGLGAVLGSMKILKEIARLTAGKSDHDECTCGKCGEIDEEAQAELKRIADEYIKEFSATLNRDEKEMQH